MKRPPLLQGLPMVLPTRCPREVRVDIANPHLHQFCTGIAQSAAGRFIGIEQLTISMDKEDGIPRFIEGEFGELQGRLSALAFFNFLLELKILRLHLLH